MAVFGIALVVFLLLLLIFTSLFHIFLPLVIIFAAVFTLSGTLMNSGRKRKNVIGRLSRYVAALSDKKNVLKIDGPGGSHRRPWCADQERYTAAQTVGPAL